MKISKLFHTLYAFLMFLPVMVLPLFAININQKEVEPLTAQIEETQVVDFNQWVTFEDSTQTENGISVTVDGSNRLVIVVSDNPTGFNQIYLNTRLNLELGQKWYIKGQDYTNRIDIYISGQPSGNSNNYIVDINSINGYALYLFCPNTLSNGTYYIYPQAFNLTQMFGVGNEPTAQQFDTWYSGYYDYIESRKEILHTDVLNTLSNTDIGSQFLYSLYNPLKDYFNLPNYMKLGGLYDWFLANLFSGYNSPVYFIIFDLMIYWLAMSLLWLIFDVLMYVPSMIHKMLDKARME